jgi:hypothetical protein
MFHNSFLTNQEIAMKKTLVLVGSVFAAMMVSASVWAADPAPMAPAGMAATDMEHPCKAIEASCKAAGFVKGKASEGKGLWKNCMQPIMDGQSVAGVSVDAATMQACQAKMKAKKM